MQDFARTSFWIAKMLTACLLAWQLAGCGSDVDPVSVSEAAEVRVSDTLPGATGAATKPASAEGSTIQTASAAAVPAANTGAVSTIDSSDPRVVWWIDPRMRLADLKKWQGVTQVYGPNQHLENVPEPGIVGSGTDYALSRSVDPLDSTKSAFRHRLSSAFPTWGSVGATRSEISANWTSDGTNVMRGVDYWVAFAVKFDPDMFGSGNGGASLLEFHQVPDEGENWLPSSFNMYASENAISFSVRWDTAQPSISKNPAQKTLWSESGPSTTQWHWIVMKVRLHWDSTRNPYMKIWRAVGNGPLQQLVDYDGPNDYRNNAPYIPQKFGVYRWDAWSGKPTRTIHTKGLYVIKADTGSPVINEQSMLGLLRQI